MATCAAYCSRAGVALASAGGPDAVVLREATRRAGVAPNAAYRHFSSRADLLQAVRVAALSRLARRHGDGTRTRRHERRGGGSGAGEPRRGWLGLSHLRAHRDRDCSAPCWLPARPGRRPIPPRQGRAASTRSSSSVVALDRLVVAGVLPPERRAGAEHLAWSAVHGLAMLIIEGPLAGRRTGTPSTRSDAASSRWWNAGCKQKGKVAETRRLIAFEGCRARHNRPQRRHAAFLAKARAAALTPPGRTGLD